MFCSIVLHYIGGVYHLQISHKSRMLISMEKKKKRKYEQKESHREEFIPSTIDKRFFFSGHLGAIIALHHI